MAANDISGPGGSLTLTGGAGAGFTAHIAGWSASLNTGIVETTGFSDAGNRTVAATALQWSGAFDGTGQVSGGAMLPTSGASPSMTAFNGTITLASASGHSFAFPCVISGMNFARRFDGKYDVSGNFISNGATTETGS